MDNPESRQVDLEGAPGLRNSLSGTISVKKRSLRVVQVYLRSGHSLVGKGLRFSSLDVHFNHLGSVLLNQLY